METMLRIRKNMNLIMLTVLLTFSSSFSQDKEMQDQPLSQPLINFEITGLIASVTKEQVGMTNFFEQTNWYKNLNPVKFGVNAMILAYEVFDEQGNRLLPRNVIAWVEDTDSSLELTVNNLEKMIEADLDKDVYLVFVSGLLIKAMDENNFEYAEVDSYEIFDDYFSSRQNTTDIVFKESRDNESGWILMKPPVPQGNLDYPIEFFSTDDKQYAVNNNAEAKSLLD